MVKALLLMAIGMTLQVQWEYPSDPTSFHIYHWRAGREEVRFSHYSTVPGTSRTKVFTGLSSNQKHFFAATAVTTDGESGFSNISRTGVPSSVVRGKVTGTVQ